MCVCVCVCGPCAGLCGIFLDTILFSTHITVQILCICVYIYVYMYIHMFVCTTACVHLKLRICVLGTPIPVVINCP